MIDDLLHGARCHYLTAVDTRTRADINNVVCVSDSVLVVFHHEHGITEVPQMNQRAQQPRCRVGANQWRVRRGCT